MTICMANIARYKYAVFDKMTEEIVALFVYKYDALGFIDNNWTKDYEVRPY